MTARVEYRTCPLCEATCGLEITLDGDSIVRIRGDRHDVFSAGFICPKGSALKQLDDDPDRLRVPAIRRGEEWASASWEEAFAEVERGLSEVIDRHGRSALASYVGNPTVHSLAGTLYIRPLLKALGSMNIFTASTVDQIPKHVSCGLMFGDPLFIPVPDIDRTDYMLILGANPWESNGSLATAPDFPGRLKAIQERGGRFVVVDPRRSRTAIEASEHLFIRPGTDAHLLMAMVHVLFEDGLVRPGRLTDFINGTEEVREAARDMTPERASSVCGIDAGDIRRIAHELAAADRAVVYGRMGTSTVEFGSIASWLVDVLNALTGNLDRAGGAMFPTAAHERFRNGPGGRGFEIGRWKTRVRGLPEVRGEIPVAALAGEITTPGAGQIRALFTVAGNPVLSTPNGAQLDEALSSLEFMVSLDLYRNETTRHANVILPPPRTLARSHYDVAFYLLAVRNVANYSPPLVELGPDERREWETMLRLALIAQGAGTDADHVALDEALLRVKVDRAVQTEGGPLHGRDPDEIVSALGSVPGPDRVVDFMLRAGPYGDHFNGNPEGLSLDRLKRNPHGLDLGPLEERLPGLLQTRSGKVELAPPDLMADVARLNEAASGNGSLVLVGRRDLRSNNSWMHNLRVLTRGKPRCTLHVHPDDARARSLSDGQTAQVTSRVGKVEAVVEVTEDVMAGVVSLPHGWGHDMAGSHMKVAEEFAGVNSNVLADDELVDPVSGNAVLNGIPVAVEAAEAG